MLPKTDPEAQVAGIDRIESELKILLESSPPPWRQLENNAVHRAKSYVPSENDLKMVKYALSLRKPLFVEGYPGCGKSSLIDYVASKLKLGPVYKWHINSRSTCKEGLYHYDAISRMADLSKDGSNPRPVGQYITLGPLGTALLPSKYPRALLIDEIDKADIDLPNDLLNQLENGFFEIEELMRDTSQEEVFRVRKARGFSTSKNGKNQPTNDLDDRSVETSSNRYAEIGKNGVQSNCFPFIVITSNKEREMPAPFLRRCLRYEMMRPDAERLKIIVQNHLKSVDLEKLQEWIELFAKLPDENLERPVDDLIESIFLFMQLGGLSENLSNEERENLKTDIRTKIWEVDNETLEALKQTKS
jgi:MoxR-like ATPase